MAPGPPATPILRPLRSATEVTEPSSRSFWLTSSAVGEFSGSPGEMPMEPTILKARPWSRALNMPALKPAIITSSWSLASIGMPSWPDFSGVSSRVMPASSK